LQCKGKVEDVGEAYYREYCKETNKLAIGYPKNERIVVSLIPCTARKLEASENHAAEGRDGPCDDAKLAGWGWRGNL
jgi:hypothetical protein